jgi:hypothetical protein
MVTITHEATAAAAFALSIATLKILNDKGAHLQGGGSAHSGMRRPQCGGAIRRTAGTRHGRFVLPRRDGALRRPP